MNTLILPRILNKSRISNNYIYQLILECETVEVIFVPLTTNRVNGYILTNLSDPILITPTKQWSEISNYDKVLYLKNLNDYQNIEECIDKDFIWLKHPLLNQEYTLTEINNSWENSLTLKKENRERGIKGLRRPQIGAIYATYNTPRNLNKFF